MTMIRATIQGGRLEVDVPADWPDGTEVEVHPREQGTPGDADMMSAEEIAGTLSAMDRVQPLEMTDAEWAAWGAGQRARTRLERARFMEHAESLRRVWE
jgi:hypothetical protein